MTHYARFNLAGKVLPMVHRDYAEIQQLLKSSMHQEVTR